jgi:hypothetical protein
MQGSSLGMQHAATHRSGFTAHHAQPVCSHSVCSTSSRAHVCSSALSGNLKHQQTIVAGPCTNARMHSVVARSGGEALALHMPLHQSSDSASTSGSCDSKSINTASVWELDFCSRPMIDERGKKVWELLICDPQRTFEYAEYFPNSKINSGEVGSLPPTIWAATPLPVLHASTTCTRTRWHAASCIVVSVPAPCHDQC